jgi:hypothetical protein
MITGFLVVGIVTVLSSLVFMARMDIYKWLGYANIVDVVFTIMLVALMHGSFPGIVSAAFAGIVMSAMLYALKNLMGYKRLRCVRVRWYKGCYRMQWVYVPPTWKGKFVWTTT